MPATELGHIISAVFRFCAPYWTFLCVKDFKKVDFYCLIFTVRNCRVFPIDSYKMLLLFATKRGRWIRSKESRRNRKQSYFYSSKPLTWGACGEPCVISCSFNSTSLVQLYRIQAPLLSISYWCGISGIGFHFFTVQCVVTGLWQLVPSTSLAAPICV